MLYSLRTFGPNYYSWLFFLYSLGFMYSSNSRINKTTHSHKMNIKKNTFYILLLVDVVDVLVRMLKLCSENEKKLKTRTVDRLIMRASLRYNGVIWSPHKMMAGDVGLMRESVCVVVPAWLSQPIWKSMSTTIRKGKCTILLFFLSHL